MSFFAYRATINRSLRASGKPRAPEDQISRAWRAKLSPRDAAIIITVGA